MKKNSVFCFLTALAFIFFIGTSIASAQILDGAVFKLKVSAKGYMVAADETVSKQSYGITVYMLVSWDSVENIYVYSVYSQTSPGVWERMDAGTDDFDLTISTENYIFLDDHDWNVYTDGGVHIHLYFTGLIKTKTDKSGALKSATFTSLGAEINEGSTNAGDEIYGGATISGKTINANTLPFTP